MALVVGRYEGLFTRRSHISRGRRSGNFATNSRESAITP